MKRRNFLQVSSAATTLCVLEAHAVLPKFSSNAPVARSHRIKALRLQTAAPLAAMKTFYCEKIGFECIAETSNELSFWGGKTKITFVKSNDPQLKPFYHFAFNIPENKILDAYAWQKERAELVSPRPGATNSARSTGHPREIHNFNHWNAHALFFLDPAANLVEFIARHDLPNASTKKDFGVKDILYASEIGFIVDAPEQEAKQFQQHLQLNPYIGNSATFQPMGDQYGLLLVLQKNTLWTDFSGKGHPTAVFETEAIIHAEQKLDWSLPDYPYRVLME